MDAADSAKGTLVTWVEADETVEEAPCVMGTFYSGESQTRHTGDEEMGGAGGGGGG